MGHPKASARLCAGIGAAILVLASTGGTSDADRPDRAVGLGRALASPSKPAAARLAAARRSLRARVDPDSPGESIEFYYAEELEPSAAPTPAPAEPEPMVRPKRPAPSLDLEAHRPRLPEDAPGSWAPARMRAELLIRRGQILEGLGAFEGARAAFTRAIALGRDDLPAWRGLGRTRLRCGDLEGAEAAFRLGLALPELPERERAALLRELGELSLLARRPARAEAIFEQAHELAPSMPRLEALQARARAEQQEGHSAAASAAALPLWPESSSALLRDRIEAALRRGVAGAPGPLRRAMARFEEPGGRRTGLLIAGLLALVPALVRALRGRGDLVVSIDYPAPLTGVFRVHIATRPRRRARPHADDPGPRAEAPRRSPETTSVAAAADSNRIRALARRLLRSRTEHDLVSRRTHFRKLPPGRYYVWLEGTLRHPDSEQPVATPSQEGSVVVRGRDVAQVDFDVAPRACWADVKVLFDRRPAAGAGVAVRGMPQSLRYARDGEVRMGLPAGAHTLVVGSGDRVAEQTIEVDGFEPLQVEIDLAGSETLAFRGCPPAVEPYLRGDVSAAARALERDGHEEEAHLVLARFHEEQGRPERAADHFESAGHPREAARLREALGDFAGAAVHFEAYGDGRRAALMYREAGELARAGEAFESVGDYDDAVACFREVGDVPRWIAALEGSGRLFEAGELALAKDERASGLRLLASVPSQDAHFADACERLVQVFVSEGDGDLAASKLSELDTAAGAAGVSSELRYSVAVLLEGSGEMQRALDGFEQLRQSDPDYRDICTRIEGLRKKLSARSLGGGSAGSSESLLALGAERYELLEELGRGGMGVVYRARDRRLGRIVALKKLPDTLREHPRAVELFLNEAQACARLNHRNIVTVHDVDHEGGAYFITMELLEGRAFNQILQRKGRITPRDAARLGIQIAAGLDYAHQKGIVHRDVKSANLFLTVDRNVKIMDFGLAKMVAEVRRATTVIGGTPYYMAPEQALGDAVDQRADLYSFGVTLFELLTGAVPFAEGDVVYQHRHAPVPDPRGAVPEIPESLAELVLELLEKDPAARPASADLVGRRLEAAAG